MNSIKENIQSILQRESQAILNIPVTDEFEKAISLIVEQIHIKKENWLPVEWGKPGK